MTSDLVHPRHHTPYYDKTKDCVFLLPALTFPSKKKET
jgi:hypothetical protein